MPQRSPRRSRLLAVTAALSLAVAACGGDDDDDATDDTTAATEVPSAATTGDTTAATTGDTTAATTAGTTAGTTGATSSGETHEAGDYVDALVEEIGGGEGADCVAESIVEAVGTDRIEASGVAPEDFAGAGSLEDVDLAIDPANAESLQADLESCPSLIDLFAEAADATEEQVECVRDNVSEALIAELLVVQFTGAAPSQELIDAQVATQECSGN